MFIRCHGNFFAMLLDGDDCFVFVPLFQPATIISQYNSVGEQVVHEGAEHTVQFGITRIFI
jgi:hypothetical protein